MISVSLLVLWGLAATARVEARDKCVDCHVKTTPDVVTEWRASRHSARGATCSTCHGSAHITATDVAKAATPTPDTCARCHETQVRQFTKGKHALAWSAMKALPTFHWQPMAAIDGMQGCEGCHKIGLKGAEETHRLAKQGHGHGLASCDACHTPHLFSLKEARQPQACQGCHTGFDQSEWEMYAGSKHGVRALLKQAGAVPPSAAAPTCQTCHMPAGTHEVRTAWGSLAVRLPFPEESQWTIDRGVILQALNIADVEGGATPRFEAMEEADMLRRDEESWQRERDAMIAACSGCHSADFARAELAKGDRMIRESDHLLSQALDVMAQLYRAGGLPIPPREGNAFPDLFSFSGSSTPIEQRLFLMFMKHRARAVKGTFHSNPEYAFWHGWHEMKRDLAEIQAAAQTLRQSTPAAQPSPAPQAP